MMLTDPDLEWVGYVAEVRLSISVVDPFNPVDVDDYRHDDRYCRATDVDP